MNTADIGGARATQDRVVNLHLRPARRTWSPLGGRLEHGCAAAAQAKLGVGEHRLGRLALLTGGAPTLVLPVVPIGGALGRRPRPLEDREELRLVDHQDARRLGLLDLRARLDACHHEGRRAAHRAGGLARRPWRLLAWPPRACGRRGRR